ncbi:9773_t:CDS:2 [Dentiscutata heterogama]|uniref:9773_t:CDS:1 n=1 Tax=Dentiscutata heterogama TaxID=1316150 RepID=A0ACA9LUP3_9GLOM|nr:9773_t:CDS:2 [Dentiscutata heterogama]
MAKSTSFPEFNYVSQFDPKYCSTCHSEKPADFFESGNKTCSLCLSRLNERHKRKREEQDMDNVNNMQEKAVELEKIEDVVYQESVDVEEDGKVDLELL